MENYVHTAARAVRASSWRVLPWRYDHKDGLGRQLIDEAAELIDYSFLNRDKVSALIIADK